MEGEGSRKSRSLFGDAGKTSPTRTPPLRHRQRIVNSTCAALCAVLSCVILRRDLDHVAADDVRAFQAAQDRQRLAGVSPPTSGVPVPGA